VNVRKNQITLSTLYLYSVTRHTDAGAAAVILDTATEYMTLPLADVNDTTRYIPRDIHQDSPPYPGRETGLLTVIAPLSFSRQVIDTMTDLTIADVLTEDGHVNPTLRAKGMWVALTSPRQQRMLLSDYYAEFDAALEAEYAADAYETRLNAVLTEAGAENPLILGGNTYDSTMHTVAYTHYLAIHPNDRDVILDALTWWQHPDVLAHLASHPDPTVRERVTRTITNPG
jgi:hypothetical protein